MDLVWLRQPYRRLDPCAARPLATGDDNAGRHERPAPGSRRVPRHARMPQSVVGSSGLGVGAAGGDGAASRSPAEASGA